MALNAYLIYSLSQNRMEKTAIVYQYSCIISAVSSFYVAFFVAIIVDVRILHFLRLSHFGAKMGEKNRNVYLCAKYKEGSRFITVTVRSYS